MESWKDLEAFENIDLQDSFVIGWKNSDETFFIDMEVSIWPGHKDYEKPKKDEYTCYKKGRLIFRSPQNVKGLLNINDVTPNKVLPEEIPDYDTVDDLEIGDTEFHLVGAFGDVTLSAKSWDFKIVYKHT